MLAETPKPLGIPGHTLFRRVGAGGYGEVWLAQTDAGEWRAVKVVRRQTFGSDKPFQREWRAVQTVAPATREVPELATVHAVGDCDEGFFYTLDLADDVVGGREFRAEEYAPHTLAQQVDLEGRLEFDDCLRIGQTLAAALHGLHTRGLVHCDVKPSNVIFIDGQPRLADVGLVRTQSSVATAVGTAGYVPPEGIGRPAGDLYALGVVLYEMATGCDRMDFPRFPTLTGGERTESLLALNEVIVRACHPEPSRRYATAKAMATDLRRLAQGQSLVPQRQPARWLLTLVLLLIISGIAMNVRDNPQTKDGPDALPLVLPAGDAPGAGVAALEKHLIAYYPFHGDTRDHGRHGHHASALHTAWGTDRLGNAHGALRMTALTLSRVDVPLLPVNGPGLSVCFWLHPFEPDLEFDQQLISHDFANRGAFKALLQAGWLTGWFKSDSGEYSVAIPISHAHQWQHIAFTFTPGDTAAATAWLDGKLVAYTPAIGRIIDSPDSLSVGGKAPGYAGLLENLRIYDRALAAEEVQALYQAEAAAPADLQPVAWDFQHQFQSVFDTQALHYIVTTNNVQRVMEAFGHCANYWAPVKDGEVGTLVYRFPFGASKVKRAHFSCVSHSWDFEGSKQGKGRGAVAVGASRDGQDWVWLHGSLHPQPKWGGAALYYEDLPEAVLGGTDLWLKIELMTLNTPPDAGYSTAHHAGSLPKNRNAFDLKVVLAK